MIWKFIIVFGINYIKREFIVFRSISGKTSYRNSIEIIGNYTAYTENVLAIKFSMSMGIDSLCMGKT